MRNATILQPVHMNGLPLPPKMLLVDDDETVRSSLGMLLKRHGFDVITAAGVADALRLIGSQQFDVLLSDLRMPGAGDGLTVVSAMRHLSPETVTMIFSSYPDLKEAAASLLLQADEVLVKPIALDTLVDSIKERIKRGASAPTPAKESVADVLEHSAQFIVEDWLLRVELEPEIITVRLNHGERCAHLPQLVRDLIYRLRCLLPLGTRALASPAAAEHGGLRQQQGYTAAMLAEESRMFQVSIFQTLHTNITKLDCSQLMRAVMEVADEVDSQLAQAMTSFVAAAEAAKAEDLALSV